MSDVMDRLRNDRWKKLGRDTSARGAGRRERAAKKVCPSCGRPWLRDDTRCSLCGTAR